MSGFLYGAPLDMPDRALCVSFTGHRPKSLPWGDNERAEGCVALKSRLEDEIRAAYAQGKRFFLSGMAEGVDTYAAEAVLSLRSELSELRLICVFPYGLARSARQRRITDAADRIVSLAPSHTPGCMMARNRFLVSRSSMLIAVYSGNVKSGTAATMRMALEAEVKLRVIPVN